MSQWRFLYPWVFVVLALLPLAWWIWLRPAWRTAVRYSAIRLASPSAGRWAARLRLILPILRTLSLMALIVAVARPQKGDTPTRIFSEGIAIQMVVDTSSSMDDYDLAPPGTRKNRLDVVKDVFRRFVVGGDGLPGRSNDLIGMIRFAQYADSICPLTLDHDALLNVLDSVDIVRVRSEDGTAIGDGLALAVERMKDLKRVTGVGEQLQIKSRVIILLTDGENNAGHILPVRAGELAATYGIKVYTILAGTGQRIVIGRMPVDDSDLRQIAEMTGGQFFHAQSEGALQSIYDHIDALERTRVEERRYEAWAELFEPFVLAAFVATCLQMALDATRLRKIP